jgi:prepilin-type N-terminal cleavage/methylation domain-containing protein
MRTRGFSLVELLLAVVVLGVVAAATLTLLTGTQRITHAQTARSQLQSNVRMGAALLPQELRELAPSDLLQIASDSITYRAMRGFGLTCGVAADQIRLRAAAAVRVGWRDPQPGRDSLLLFVEGDPLTGADDRWVTLPVLSVGSTRCGPDAAVALATAIDTLAVPLGSISLGGPARLFEVMQVKAYRQGADWWLGAHSLSAGETLQPVLGPLTAGGLALRYTDLLGATTAVRDSVRSVLVTVRGTSEPVRQRGVVAPLQDSLVALVRLRNAPWP